MNKFFKPMSFYKIFNHTSETMSEIKDGAIDLIITDPPWNIGVKFGNKTDSQTTKQYEIFINKIAQELLRVLSNKGLCAIACAKKVRYENKNIELGNTYQQLFTSAGFNLVEATDIIFNERNVSNWSVIPLSAWNKNDSSWGYSAEGSALVFSKEKNTHGKLLGAIENKVYEFNKEDGHPCPTSISFVSDILGLLFKKGMSVLDPFMGTANLGVEVLKRGGNFYGYEIANEYFGTAKNKLDKI